MYMSWDSAAGFGARGQPSNQLKLWRWTPPTLSQSPELILIHSFKSKQLPSKMTFLTLFVSVLSVFGFVLKYLKPKRGEGRQNAREIVKMINSNIIVKMEMNFALSPKCHFMVMNSISMKMSIEAEPQLEQHRISNEYFPTQNSFKFKVQKSKTKKTKS